MRYDFEQPRNQATFTCSHVLAGAPILYVILDDEHDWQFHCGADEHATEEMRLVCLEDVVRLDPTLNELAMLRCCETATRVALGAPFEITDPTDEKIRQAVADGGWFVIGVQDNDGNSPRFSYTIGLRTNFDHPEILVFGLRVEVAHSLLNELGDRIQSGERFDEGARISGILGGVDVALRAIRPNDEVMSLFAYANWYLKTRDHQVMQCVWPDNENRFPWELGCNLAGMKHQRLFY